MKREPTFPSQCLRMPTGTIEITKKKNTSQYPKLLHFHLNEYFISSSNIRFLFCFIFVDFLSCAHRNWIEKLK